MGWFGDLDLGIKYAIVLGSLVTLVFAAGFIKLFVMRQRTRKYQAEAKAKAANEEGKIEQIALNQREEGEGDLFGIRALERGFTGGVAQSRPSTPNPHMSTSTLVPSAVNIPFGQKSVGSATSSVITIDVGNPKPVQPAVTSDRIAPQFAKRSDVAVDMQLAVPESPRLPRSPESPKFPRETTRSPSPLSHNLPHLDSTIPSGGLGLNSYAQSSASGARKIQSKSPLEVNVPTRGISIISNAASVVDEDSPPGSPSRSSHHSNGSQSGPSTNFSRPPPSPPRGVYQTHRPQIKVDAPRSDSPTAPTGEEAPVPAMNPGGLVGGKDNGNKMGEGYGLRLSINNGNGAINRVSSQSLAEVYDSYYDKRESNATQSVYMSAYSGSSATIYNDTRS